MDKIVAEALWQIAARRQHLEYLKWMNMAKLASVAQVEAQRVRVAAWATAANELYDQARREPASTNGAKPQAEITQAKEN